MKKNKQSKELKLDLACGALKKEGFIGVDIRKFKGVDIVCDLTKKWRWKTNSVDEVHCAHYLEHLAPKDRIHFINELYRVLKPDAKATLICPHWCSTRAYGDLTHAWPPVSEYWFYYLRKEWRNQHAPHTNDDYKCNFECTWGYGLHPSLETKSEEYKVFAVNNYKEVVADTVATLTKK